MFFINTFRKRRILRKINTIFESTFEIKHNAKLSKTILCDMYFPNQKIAVIFGDYDSTNKNIIELEKTDIKIFNIPYKEDIFLTSSRLLFVLTHNTNK